MGKPVRQQAVRHLRAVRIRLVVGDGGYQGANSAAAGRPVQHRPASTDITAS